MSEFLDKTRRLRMTGIEEMQLLPNCECLQVSRKMGLLQNRIKGTSKNDAFGAPNWSDDGVSVGGYEPT